MSPHLRQLTVFAGLCLAVPSLAAEPFDHSYAAYGAMLRAHVTPPRVDYALLTSNRASLDRSVADFDAVTTRGERAWARAERMAFWINAYNAFTLRAIVDHYPIRSGLLTRHPRNSIRQIDEVWTTLKWRAAGRSVTLDDIEHRILRPEFKDARIHFAVNCASTSCPPLAVEPYRARTLDAQAGEVEGKGSARERAVVGAVITYGPPDVAARARTGTLAIRYLDYNWALNDR